MPHLERGIVEVYTGNGKGKTTASIGLAIRAFGGHYVPIIFQFMKSGGYSGEFNELTRLGIEAYQYGRPCSPLGDGSPNPKCFEPHPEDKDYAQRGFEHAKRATLSGHYDLVIMDEINFAVFKKLVDESQLLDLIKNKPAKVELILTGRNASPAIIGAADLVTEMKEIKHPYVEGITARKGIEY